MKGEGRRVKGEGGGMKGEGRIRIFVLRDVSVCTGFVLSVGPSFLADLWLAAAVLARRADLVGCRACHSRQHSWPYR